MISTRDCRYDATKRQLHHVNMTMAFTRTVDVQSHHTGRTLTFRQIGADHPLSDPDGWDGEMAIYEPVALDTHVRLLIISRG